MQYFAVRKAELIYMNRAMRRVFSATLKIYREAVQYIGPIVLKHWAEITRVDTAQERKGIVETLIHHTQDNPSPLYIDFDRLFYKFPSYFRRSAIEFVLGQVSSYLTRLAQWEEERHEAMSNGRHFGKRPPVLNLETNACPTLYKGNMYKTESGHLYIKVYIRNTWDWVEVSIAERDIRSLSQMEQSAKKVCCPTLSYRYGKYYLIFPFKPLISEFPKLPLDRQLVMGVDLGVNHGAVCSVSDITGKIYCRAFDPFASKRAGINDILGKIRDRAKKSGGASLASLYTKLDGRKEDYVCQLARWIVDRARAEGVYGIVFEHLGKMKWHGSRKEKLHHWCKRRIQDMVKGMAFRYGIRVFFISPRNTSALAYDGSGRVLRGADNFSMCTFASGKQYHCDLSASYNICARYFLREMEKAMSFEAWGQLTAKVPELAKRTNCTLSTLWKIHRIFTESKAA